MLRIVTSSVRSGLLCALSVVSLIVGLPADASAQRTMERWRLETQSETLPGDPARRIDMRATAKQRESSRLFERALSGLIIGTLAAGVSRLAVGEEDELIVGLYVAGAAAGAAAAAARKEGVRWLPLLGGTALGLFPAIVGWEVYPPIGATVGYFTVPLGAAVGHGMRW